MNCDITRVKICGMTNLEDALVAVEAGADLLGFIFYESSPRYVRPEVVREIVSGVKCQSSVSSKQLSVSSNQSPGITNSGQGTTNNSLPLFVGVFVNSPLETVARLLDFCRLDAAQLHGDESPEFVRHFQNRTFKALRPQSAEEAEALIQKYLPAFPPSHLLVSSPPPYSLLPTPYFLLDAYHPTLYGGTSHAADWGMTAGIARRYPILLAGSLTPENVAEAVQVVQPWGVDVSSGVEREKGKKDHKKVRAFVEAVKSVKRKTSCVLRRCNTQDTRRLSCWYQGELDEHQR